MPNRKLKAERELKAVNQSDVAKFLGISSNTYWNKENGKTEFTVSEAKKLAEYFGVSVVDLFFKDIDNKKFTEGNIQSI
ncbi:XRE family transcriptional regulator [Romboutsia ilealis]|uniref:Helix-turn-helix transcriptional regulator n=1 Tax=Romboutsia faecis TaxID=2764597 RepID=A0ABR7JSQ6_9FIRM|nr:helix-turn-helix transcriptional regulator [Romboutsia faecis]MBC5997944.1 helix-turn-helix transcriptional regulator [Romboutsia faecis]MRN25639.1 XRE family transcriptional regulator [Romboutsia ilealis]